MPSNVQSLPASRCPFCHTAVAIHGRDWAACALCLARHHETCLRESPVCACCGHARFLAARSNAAWSRLTWASLALAWIAIIALAGSVAEVKALREKIRERLERRSDSPPTPSRPG
jgi:hypothetical protein